MTAGFRHSTREWRALTHLSSTACPVPGVLGFEPDPATLGRPFLLMEHISGESFWSTYEAAHDVGARSGLVRSFVQPLVALHDLDGSEWAAAAAQSPGYDSIDRELAGLRHDVTAFPRAGLVEVVHWLQERRDAVPCARPVILHRDYHPWNAIVDATGKIWVLDWDWQIGDPRFDLAWTCTLLQRSGHDALSDAVRAEYARQSGAAALEQLAYFEVLATLRWLLNVLPALGVDSQLGTDKRAAFRSFLLRPLHRAQRLVGQHCGLEVRLTA